jgi:hypothetical protein
MLLASMDFPGDEPWMKASLTGDFMRPLGWCAKWAKKLRGNIEAVIHSPLK